MRKSTLRCCAGAALLLAASSGAGAASVYSSGVITNTNPSIYWDLEETTGTTAADQATARPAASGALTPLNNGTYVNATLGQFGPRPSDGFAAMEPESRTPSANNAPSFVTVNDQIGAVEYTSLATAAGVGTGQYTMQAWFNSSAAYNNKALSYFLSRGVGTGTTANTELRDSIAVGGNAIASGKLVYYQGGSNGIIGTGTTTLNANTWYHAAMVRNGDAVTVYLNGNQEFSTNAPWLGGTGDRFTAANRTDYPAFESMAGNVGLGIEGRVDEVAVWDRALSASEVSALYTSAVPEPASAGLLATGLLGLAGRGRHRA